jgi:hypothetical protein
LTTAFIPKASSLGPSKGLDYQIVIICQMVLREPMAETKANENHQCIGNIEEITQVEQHSPTDP